MRVTICEKRHKPTLFWQKSDALSGNWSNFVLTKGEKPMSITSIIRPLFARRIKAAEQYPSNSDELQRTVLRRLLSMARNTETGRRYRFDTIDGYYDYSSRVPVVEYEAIRDDVMRMVRGEANVLWPGVTRHYAQSSGTSGGRSKYIPITSESFKWCHYQGGFDVVAHYLHLNPDSRMFDGRSFILGGSFANELTLPRGVRVGDLSANLIDGINPLANLVRVPSKRVALMSDWSRKLPALVEASKQCNITNISGVPSWFLTVLKEVIKARGANNIHEVWPNLEVFFHGGISFAPYRSEYAAICDPSRMHYLETYNASEGFFALQSSWDTTAMLLLPDLGVFYEFQPIDNPDARPVPIWEVQQGRTYSLIISACNGLWRYAIGDTVTIESTAPVKIRIAGRTKHYINAFGEELMVHNADAAIEKASAATGMSILNYTAAPVFTSGTTKGHHQWLVEFAVEPDDAALQRFAKELDRCVRAENSDYDAKRTSDIFLAPLEVVAARHGLFDDWLLATSGRLGGQKKIPRLQNDRKIIEQMLTMNKG